MCDSRLASYIVFNFIIKNDEFYRIEDLNAFSNFFSKRCVSMFVTFVTDEHTVGRKWFTVCGDLASWIFFMEVCILITSCWILVAMITTFHFISITRLKGTSYV